MLFRGIGLDLSSHDTGFFTLGVEVACLIELLSTRDLTGAALAVPFWTESRALRVSHGLVGAGLRVQHAMHAPCRPEKFGGVTGACPRV